MIKCLLYMYVIYFFLKKGYNFWNKIKFIIFFEYVYLLRMVILVIIFYRILVRGYRIVVLLGLVEV